MRDASPEYYEELFETIEYLPDRMPEIAAATALVFKGKDDYERVAVRVSLPWYVVGAIHLMEASCSWKMNLLNGQPLDQVTTIWPIGRGPWDSWEKMADEVTSDNRWRWQNLKEVPRIGICLQGIESWNGWGYRRRRVNSPYLWAGSNHGEGVGKFTSDGHYDPLAVSDQIGAAVVIKRLLEV